MKQLEFKIKTHGGARKNSGRKKTGRMSHKKRDRVNPKHPLHITVRLRQGAPSLRRTKIFKIFCRACREAMKQGIRILHYAALGNHFHILVEADSNASLASAMRSLNIRIAKALNAIAETRGKILQDRYHANTITTPTQMKNAMVYVFANAAKHLGLKRVWDEFSSYALFQGELTDKKWDWRRAKTQPPDYMREAVTNAKTWLASQGWRRVSVTT